MCTVAEEGRTVLFVSHDMTTVRSLCSRALRLDLAPDGLPAAVVGSYISETVIANPAVAWSDPTIVPGIDCVRNRQGELAPWSPGGRITIRTPFDIIME